MSNAIWAIFYDLQPAREDEYLEWFHQIHIPEKLAREGYSWASHYQIERVGEGSPSNGNMGCIALFGGDSSSVFYNPSPAQMKPTQPADTKDMLGIRINARSLILSSEWEADGQNVVAGTPPAIDAEMISAVLCDATGNDEDFGAWLVQQHLKSNPQGADAVRTRKYLASTGGAKHVIFHEYSGSETAGLAFSGADNSDWNARVEGYVSYPLGASMSAKRIWPVIS